MDKTTDMYASTLLLNRSPSGFASVQLKVLCPRVRFLNRPSVAEMRCVPKVRQQKRPEFGRGQLDVVNGFVMLTYVV